MADMIQMELVQMVAVETLSGGTNKKHDCRSLLGLITQISTNVVVNKSSHVHCESNEGPIGAGDQPDVSC